MPFKLKKSKKPKSKDIERSSRIWKNSRFTDSDTYGDYECNQTISLNILSGDWTKWYWTKWYWTKW